jgi:hypothetical protein
LAGSITRRVTSAAMTFIGRAVLTVASGSL